MKWMTGRRCLGAALALAIWAVGPAWAEDVAMEMTLSAYVNEAAPAPDVPPSERVDSACLAGAVLVGDSMGDGLAIHGVAPGLQLLARIGLSPQSALTEEAFQDGGKPVTLVDKLSAMRPDAVYLWLGSNGLAAMGVEQVTCDYDRLLNQLLEALPDIPFYLLEVTPVRELTQEGFADLRNERIDAFNQALREVAKRHNVYVLEINALLKDEEGLLGEAYAAEDGTHLLRPAYEALAEHLYTHVLPLAGTAEEGE